MYCNGCGKPLGVVRYTITLSDNYIVNHRGKYTVCESCYKRITDMLTTKTNMSTPYIDPIYTIGCDNTTGGR